MKKGFVIKSESEEAFEVTLNGKSIASVNHDEHGWAGMSLVRDTVDNIAKVLHLSVKEEEVEDEELEEYKVTDNEILEVVRSNGPLGKAVREFSNQYGTIEQAGLQRKPPTPLEVRWMQIKAVYKIAAALGVNLETREPEPARPPLGSQT